MTLQEHYRVSVTNALAGFQLVEESLKGYLGLYYQSIRHLLSGRLHFDFHRADINEAPLGRLVGSFSKSCANALLVARLRSLIKHRDTTAHKALVCLYESATTDEQYHDMIKANHRMSDETREVLIALSEEVAAMRKSTFDG